MPKKRDLRGVVVGRSRAGCPPRGPHLVEALKEGIYAARCLKCGLVGLERKDA
jgi:hypothetical protein